jgi:hypothetical protein
MILKDLVDVVERIKEWLAFGGNDQGGVEAANPNLSDKIRDDTVISYCTGSIFCILS